MIMYVLIGEGLGFYGIGGELYWCAPPVARAVITGPGLYQIEYRWTMGPLSVDDLDGLV